MLALTLMLLQPQTAPQTPPVTEAAAEDEIIVTGRHNYCTMSVDGHPLGERDLDRRAREWSKGRPLRVVVRDVNDFPCLTKIALQLSRKGVSGFVFVGPPGQEAKATSGDLPQLIAPADQRQKASEDRARALIRQGRCEEAAEVLNAAGNVTGAATLLPGCVQR